MGSAGTRHGAYLRELGVEVLWYDPEPDRMWSGRRVETWEDGVAARPDGVLICSPIAVHGQQALAAVEAGIPCFVEKPLAATVEEGMAVVWAANQYRVGVMVGYQFRFLPSLQVLRVEAQQATCYAAQMVFAYDLAKWHGGGAPYRGDIVAEASHELDLLCQWWGEPAHVQGVTQCIKQKELPDCAWIGLRWPGRLAGVYVDGIAPQYLRVMRLFDQCLGMREWIFDEQENVAAYRQELRTFLEGITTGQVGLGCTGAEGVRVLRVIARVQASAA